MINGNFLTLFKYECRSLIRGSRFWTLLIILPLLTIAIAPRLVWNRHFLGYPCVILSVYFVPLLIYAPAWRTQSPLRADLRLTRMSNLEILSGFYLPRILLTLILFAAMYISVGMNMTEEWNFSLPCKYICLDGRPAGVFLISEKFAKLIGVSTRNIWSDWRIPHAIFFFASYLTYNACVVSYITNQNQSFSRSAFHFLLLTIGIESVFYTIAFLINPHIERAIVHPSIWPSATMITFDWILVHLSRAWLPWWYFCIKAFIAYRLILLASREMDQNPPIPDTRTI